MFGSNLCRAPARVDQRRNSDPARISAETTILPARQKPMLGAAAHAGVTRPIKAARSAWFWHEIRARALTSASHANP
jgi:hypothetical protein